MTRRKSRENAFILIYESFFLKIKIQDLINYAGKEQNIKLSKYAKNLVYGVLEKREEIDGKINLYLKNWNFNRVSCILISILEIAIYEIMYVDDVEIPVSINEAIELTKKYFGEEGSSFVNGVLGGFVDTI